MKRMATPEQEGKVLREIVLPLITLVKEKSETCCAIASDTHTISAEIISNLRNVIG